MTEELSTVVYSKPIGPSCVKAKALLKNKNIPYVEKIIGQDIAVETLLKEFEVNGLPARTAPQVILHGKYVGGYEKLVEHMDSHGMNYNH